jgi:hypothetical protein
VHHLTAGPWGLQPPLTRQTIDQRVLNAVDAAVVVGLLTAVTVVIWGWKFANRSTNQVRLLLSFQQHTAGANLNRFIEFDETWGG